MYRGAQEHLLKFQHFMQLNSQASALHLSGGPAGLPCGLWLLSLGGRPAAYLVTTKVQRPLREDRRA